MGNLTGSSRKKKRDKDNQYSGSKSKSKSFDIPPVRPITDENGYRSEAFSDSSRFSQSLVHSQSYPSNRTVSSTSTSMKSSPSKVSRRQCSQFNCRSFRSTDLCRELSFQWNCGNRRIEFC